jgi:15-cis-phytoene desaturase
MALHVIVIGGGVAGLTAAHELSERGAAVTVYERRPDWGGKARSQPVPDTAVDGRKPLPGEHGFRFYPRFYKHVIDVMQRIPVAGGSSVAERLKPATESAVAMVDNDTWYRFFRRRPDRPLEVLEALELFFQTFDFDAADLNLLGAKVLQFFTSCEARRFGTYEHRRGGSSCKVTTIPASSNASCAPSHARWLRWIRSAVRRARSARL